MKGDFTRSTFKPEEQYSGVRMQQGRVQLDADWNEHIDISSHRINTGARDIIGPSGAPQDGGGFKIDPTLDKKNLAISRGRIYVDGILCENFIQNTNITEQDDFPGFSQLPVNKGVYLAYLDVWQRHITAIEDPDIREVALGGPDTSTRTRTVWQVKLKALPDSTIVNGIITCNPIAEEWNNITKETDAELTAFTKQETPSKNPCIVSPGAGYRGLENQLYRVEIHTGGKPNIAKFKWSRDNGSVVFAIEKFVKDANNNPTKLKVKQPGKDKTLSLQAGDWVEVLDDVMELSDNPAGTLAQITEPPDVAGRIITLNQNVSGDLKRHPKVRRWDQGSDAISVMPPSGSDSIELEEGIFVRFSGTNFKAGDYWLIPARTATGDIEWQKDETKNPPEPIPESPEGIRHHYCRLAVLQQDSSKKWSSFDCRKLFPAVTELTSFFHVVGDGQEAMPGEELPDDGSLQVGVVNGKQPVANARVSFKIIRGSGTITSNDGSKTAIGEGNYIEVLTGTDGIANCKWKLDTATQRQQVEATLRDACDAQVNTPICFNANLSVAGEVAYKPPGCTEKDTINGIPTVEELLRSNILGWPPKDAAGNTTVKDVLDTFLCNFDATDIPIQKNNALCQRLKDDASVRSVQDALNALCSMRGGCCVFVADEEQLRKALLELKDGGVICLLAGTFEMKEAILIEHSNVVIRGCSFASKLVSDIHIGKGSNVVIEKLDISGEIRAEGVTGLYLRENIISHTEKQFFKLEQCSNVKIEKSVLHTYNGINFQGNDIEISDNIITTPGGGISIKSNSENGFIKLQDNTIISGSSGIDISSGKDLRMQGNRVETNASLIAETQGGIVTVSGLQDVDITDNRITILKPDSILTEHIIGLVISGVNGIMSVNNNIVSGVNQEAVRIRSTEASAKFHGNSFDSLWHIESITVKIISTIAMDCKDIIFGGNLCSLTIDKYNGNFKIYQVYFNGKSGNLTVMGNRCIEMKDERIYSIFASEKMIAILLGNITTNQISPLPNPQKLNLLTV